MVAVGAVRKTKQVPSNTQVIARAGFPPGQLAAQELHRIVERTW
jgi:hypothetical protein